MLPASIVEHGPQLGLSRHQAEVFGLTGEIFSFIRATGRQAGRRLPMGIFRKEQPGLNTKNAKIYFQAKFMTLEVKEQ